MKYLDTLKQALEALESCGVNYGYNGANQYFDEGEVENAITSLRQAVALEESLVADAEKQEPEYKIGQKIKVTRLTYGAAVYNNKREIINAHQPPHKLVCIGNIVEIKQECENGAVIVKCEGKDKFLPRFNFYPQNNGKNQIVEVLEQPKAEHFDHQKAASNGLREAMSRSQEIAKAAQPKRKPLTADKIGLLWDKYSHTQGALGFARAIEQAHGIGKGEV